MEEEIQKDVNDCGPQVIEHFIGQKRIVERCKIALEAAWNEGGRLPHTLMLGNAGLGKTELAHLLSKEMGCECHEQLSQNLRLPKDMHSFLLTPQDKDIVFFEEVHELSAGTQTVLLRALENQQIFLSSKQGKKSRPIQIANFSVFAATTNPEALVQPLRDRFKLILDFTFYSPSELRQLLHNRVRRLGWQIEEPVLLLIAERGKGTPRIAIRLLESVRMTACAEGADVITSEHFRRTCQLEMIDPIGLCSHEITYLRILYEHEGAARLNVIASRLGLNTRHVSTILEQFLIREGLVTKHNSVRVLTQYGLEHFRQHHLDGEQS